MIQKDISTLMCTAVLFTTTKIWKHPKSPLVEEWIKQLWEVYMMDHYLSIKKNKILPFATVLLNKWVPTADHHSPGKIPEAEV